MSAVAKKEFLVSLLVMLDRDCICYAVLMYWRKYIENGVCVERSK